MFTQLSPVRLLIHFILIVISILINTSVAADLYDENWVKETASTIKQQELLLKPSEKRKVTTESLANPLKKISQIKAQAQDCISDTGKQLQKTNHDLAILGEVTRKENPAVAKKRQSLNNEQRALSKQLSTCKLIVIQSQDLIKSINDIQQALLAKQLQARTPHILKILEDNIKQPTAGAKDTFNFLQSQYQAHEPTNTQLILLLATIVAGIFSGVILRRKFLNSIEDNEAYTDTVAILTLAIKSSLVNYLPVLIPVAFISIFFSLALPLDPLPFITKASYAFLIYLAIALTIKILLNPTPPAQSYLEHNRRQLIQLNWQLQTFATLSFLGYFLLTGEIKSSFTDQVYYLNRSIFSIALIINLIFILWMARHFSWSMLSRKPRIFLILVLILTLILELSGYRNLSTFILGGLLGTVVGFAITMIIYRFLKDLCDGLDEGRLHWERRFRQIIGLEDDALVPGLIWIRIIIFAGLWGGFAVFAMYIWRLDDPWLTLISGYITEGFEIGSLRVTPTVLASGFLALILLLGLTRYAKNNIVPHGLKYTRLDHGAKEAITSLIGYTGVAIAILVALSITGVKMENVAIIAGALSVGIGFGLQNIVNNFISGLILLFERPIRSGDWIITGDTEGYVKSINIRSTQIETFDRADVIVPNSELITAKVTNWMLKDNYGRVRIPVGVSYDSDVDKVHKILLNIANKHPMVVKNHGKLNGPKVLFREFADSSLNFELRCFIYDVDQRLNVISEMNYTILREFRANNIEIPFPQRVVTVNKTEDKLEP